jgi:hypothetical protein
MVAHYVRPFSLTFSVPSVTDAVEKLFASSAQKLSMAEFFNSIYQFRDEARPTF